MKKLKLEKLEKKHKFFKGFNILTRSLLYIPGCMLIGWVSSIMFEAVWAMILWTLCACISWDSITRLVWSKAKKKAKKIEQEISEYVETEQGEKEVVLMANIEAVKEILNEKDCKIKSTCEGLLQRLLDTKYKMANKPKVKFKDSGSGEVFYGEVVDDKIDEINLDDELYKAAEESGFFNTDEE